MRTIRHYYANRENMGDWAAALGIRQFLSAAVSDELRFVDCRLCDPVTDDDVDEINRTTDLVIVGGGGLLLSIGWPSGWMWNVRHEQMQAIKCPIVLYAIGFNDEYKHRKARVRAARSTEGIRCSAQIAALVGARDRATLEWMRQQNLGNADLVPCPSMFLRPRNESPQPDESRMGINVVPSSRVEKNDALLGVMKDLIEWLTEKGLAITYLPHAEKPNDNILALQEAFPGQLIRPRDPYELLEAYAAVKAVIGMRGHSTLFAFNRDRPVFGLTYNRKCEEFLRLLGIEQYSMPWRPRRFFRSTRVIRRRLKTQVQEFLDHGEEIRETWKSCRAFCRECNEQFSARVAALLR